MDDQALMYLSVLSALAGLVSYGLRNRTRLPDQHITAVTGALVTVGAYFSPGLGVQFALGALGLTVARGIEKGTSRVLPGPKKSPTYEKSPKKKK